MPKTVATNRRARYDFHLEDRFEAGMVLVGSEVKALRNGTANLQDAFVSVKRDGVELYNLHIPPYEMSAANTGHEPTRPRRLLLNKREIEKLRKGTESKGYTIIPTSIYFKNGRAKIEIALGKGKKAQDKRATIAERESKRHLDRVMKER